MTESLRTAWIVRPYNLYRLQATEEVMGVFAAEGTENLDYEPEAPEEELNLEEFLSTRDQSAEIHKW
ncbi:hypothetical protein [Streptomyces sp. NPDC001843]|uniref:hypothetical protein n=1 Tax=Streptomyces sp. NPDC001843 TaxID=3364617 RepID=UPI0036C0F415